MKDLTKLPHSKLSPEEQKEFERRAHIVDDDNNPPISSYAKKDDKPKEK